MSRALLQISGLNRSYVTGDKTLDVLKGVELTVMPGEIVGLIGPSGSGKSSLLHAAGLLERPDAGTILIDGEDVGALDERGRTRLRLAKIGFVYQFHHLMPEFDALDNAALPLRMGGLKQAEARRRASELLTTLGLGERLTHQPGQLSGGEQQRVAIARAFVRQPDVLFADEPTGNLDSHTGERISDLLFELNKERGTTLVLVTHDERLAHRCRRLIRLEAGRLIDSVEP